MEAYLQLLNEIQTALFIMSSSLLVGALTALHFKHKTFVDARMGLMGGNGLKEVAGPENSKEASPHPEKRRARRYRSALLLDISDSSGHFSPRIAQLMNISQMGACFYSVLPLWRGDRIRTYWHAIEGDVFMMSGRIVWQKTEGKYTVYGISFDSVLPQKRLTEATSASGSR